ncbi:YceH family protein [Ideonella sp. B7]|uniref:YceH family protein n=1 Tax=Ideonella benzenivorans TaxID=2831643 RepID=UPI001CEDE343|nr:YceH family protein [Ideonella benzenivorans]MCA6216210.1 YceH family protein [Ideonella benzenivorans]
MDSDFEPLSALQARVLGVLVEKQHTVPDTYPLSLNALVAGCNQKTARLPVMEATESEVLAVLDELRRRSLVVEVSGNRVPRFEHNLARGLNVPGQGVALLAVLMLRGPQTAAELRLNSERLHRFADISSVEAFLDELAAKTPARVLRLPRAPGEREARWAHLLCGEPVVVAGSAAAPAPPATESEQVAELRAELARQAAELVELRVQLNQLRAQLQSVQSELGLSAPTP